MHNQRYFPVLEEKVHGHLKKMVGGGTLEFRVLFIEISSDKINSYQCSVVVFIFYTAFLKVSYSGLCLLSAC